MIPKESLTWCETVYNLSHYYSTDVRNKLWRSTEVKYSTITVGYNDNKPQYGDSLMCIMTIYKNTYKSTEKINFSGNKIKFQWITLQKHWKI